MPENRPSDADDRTVAVTSRRATAVVATYLVIGSASIAVALGATVAMFAIALNPAAWPILGLPGPMPAPQIELPPPPVEIEEFSLRALSPTVAEVRFNPSVRVRPAVRWHNEADPGDGGELAAGELTGHPQLYLRGLQPNRSYLVQVNVTTAAGETVTLPAATVRTDDHVDFSVRTDHPRLYFNAETIARLREAIKPAAEGGTHAAVWQRVRRECDRDLAKSDAELWEIAPRLFNATAASLVACYQLTGDAKYASRGIAYAKFVAVQTVDGSHEVGQYQLPLVAQLYDGLFPRLNAEDELRLRTQIAALTRRVYEAQRLDEENLFGHTVGVQSGLFAGALAIAHEDAATAELLKNVIGNFAYRFSPTHRFGYGVEGGSQRGWTYGVLRDMDAVLPIFSLLKSAAADGTDPFAREAWWLKPHIQWYVFGTRGDHSFLRLGDTYRWPVFNQDSYLVARVLAREYRDPLAQWTADEQQATEQVLWGPYHVIDLLWWDPAVVGQAPSLPLSQWFRGPGEVILRESWAPESVIGEFTSAPYLIGNHQHADNLQFTLYYRGGLAVDSGIYDWDTPHDHNYYKRTIAHNTLTIFDPEEKFCRGEGSGHATCSGESRVVNDGGQRFSPRDDEFPSEPRHIDDLLHPDGRYRRGGIPVYEDTAEYTYALGRGGPSYNSAKTRRVDRHFLWLRQAAALQHPVAVVFDVVESTKPEFQKTYHLHTQGEPTLRNALTLTATSRQRFTGEAGRLYHTTLLPPEPQIKIISGAAVTTVDGKSFPPPREPTAAEEVGPYRVEITPPAAQTLDRFLHVVYATEDNGEAAPESLLVDGGTMHGVAVGDWIALFADVEFSVDRVRYSAAAGARHLLVGVRDSVPYDVLLDGAVVLREQRSTKSGTLRFDLPRGGVVQIAPSIQAEYPFRRADADGSGRLNLTDAIVTLQFLFLGGTAPGCLDAADATDDGVVNISDAIRTLQFLFAPEADTVIPQPTDQCGLDPTGDALRCGEYLSC